MPWCSIKKRFRASTHPLRFVGTLDSQNCTSSSRACPSLLYKAHHFHKKELIHLDSSRLGDSELSLRLTQALIRGLRYQNQWRPLECVPQDLFSYKSQNFGSASSSTRVNFRRLSALIILTGSRPGLLISCSYSSQKSCHFSASRLLPFVIVRVEIVVFVILLALFVICEHG